jgi:hypothetical protein
MKKEGAEGRWGCFEKKEVAVGRKKFRTWMSTCKLLIAKSGAMPGTY